MAVWSSPPSDAALLLADALSLINSSLFGRAGVFVLRTGSSIFSCSSHVFYKWGQTLQTRFSIFQLQLTGPAARSGTCHMKRGACMRILQAIAPFTWRDIEQ